MVAINKAIEDCPYKVGMVVYVEPATVLRYSGTTKRATGLFGKYTVWSVDLSTECPVRTLRVYLMPERGAGPDDYLPYFNYIGENDMFSWPVYPKILSTKPVLKPVVRMRNGRWVVTKKPREACTDPVASKRWDAAYDWIR